MNEDQLFEIACIIDNEYKGKRKTFTAKKANGGYWSLTTNVCDWASLIHVWEINNKISTIVYLNGDTENWQPITNPTWVRIETYLKSLNKTNHL